MIFRINDVVQFNENHKWCGCFGFISETKECDNDDIRYMVRVPIPQQGTAFVFVMESEYALEFIGRAILTPNEDNKDE